MWKINCVIIKLLLGGGESGWKCPVLLFFYFLTTREWLMVEIVSLVQQGIDSNDFDIMCSISKLKFSVLPIMHQTFWWAAHKEISLN